MKCLTWFIIILGSDTKEEYSKAETKGRFPIRNIKKSV